MKLAFCLFKFFPFGGLQRDFLRIAQLCHEQLNAEIDVYTMEWKGNKPAWLNIHILAVSGITNHSRCMNFAKKISNIFKELTDQSIKSNLSSAPVKPYDLIIGFNKLPHLDVYYAADGCLLNRLRQQKKSWLRFLPRYFYFLKLEKNVFDSTSKTEVLCISQHELNAYHECYQTPLTRLHLLPPGISPDRKRPTDAAERRAQMRQQLQINSNELVCLTIGSSYLTKGIDRVLNAVKILKEKQFPIRAIVLGLDNKPTAKAMTDCKNLNILNKVLLIPPQENILDLLLAADVMVHPARQENTGTVLLEALFAGLPVITTDICGYAEHIQKADAGIVLQSPFTQEKLINAIYQMHNSEFRASCQHHGLNYVATHDLSSLFNQAINWIQKFIMNKKKREINELI